MQVLFVLDSNAFSETIFCRITISSVHVHILDFLNAFLISLHSLVEILAAPLGPARARNLVVLKGELVVVRQLLSRHNPSQREDDDVLVTQDVNHLREAVGLQGDKYHINPCLQ